MMKSDKTTQKRIKIGEKGESAVHNLFKITHPCDFWNIDNRHKTG